MRTTGVPYMADILYMGLGDTEGNHSVGGVKCTTSGGTSRILSTPTCLSPQEFHALYQRCQKFQESFLRKDGQVRGWSEIKAFYEENQKEYTEIRTTCSECSEASESDPLISEDEIGRIRKWLGLLERIVALLPLINESREVSTIPESVPIDGDGRIKVIDYPPVLRPEIEALNNRISKPT